MISMEVLLAVVIMVGVVLLANRAERHVELRGLLNVTLLILNGLFAAGFGFAPEGTPLVALLAFGFAGAATLLLFGPIRARLAPLFPARRVIDQGQDVGQTVGFDPASPLQMTALILCLYLVGDTLLSFALAGGMSGLVQEYGTSGGDANGLVSPATLVTQMCLFLIFAILGTGLGTRRSLPETLARLGLRAPTLHELAAGVGVAFALLCAEFAIAIIWESLVPESVLQNQTQFSGLIISSISTLTMAFLLSFTSAVGEEIAFRGALQPIFGLWPTAIIFALTHIQYTLTPAVLIILLVGLGLGWLRQRYNTTAAITAHFLYNFALIALVVYGQFMYDTLRSLQY
jgi:hypothetical protein